MIFVEIILGMFIIIDLCHDVSLVKLLSFDFFSFFKPIKFPNLFKIVIEDPVLATLIQ